MWCPDQYLTYQAAEDAAEHQAVCTVNCQLPICMSVHKMSLLKVQQKDDCMFICTALHERVTNNPNFLSLLITGDKAWVQGFDLETKQMFVHWQTASSPRPKKAWQIKSKVKTVNELVHHELNPRRLVHHELIPKRLVHHELIPRRLVHHDLIPRGLVHHELVPGGQSVNITFYKPALCADITPRSGAPAFGFCTTTTCVLIGVTTNKLFGETQHSISVTPWCSPDLAPCDFFL